tara:strand:+ start:34478 stop:34870 length:393 start_codon:yes stop_codon:yes gene_type:complete
MTIPKKALIVDDEAHIRMFVKMVLKEVGIEEFLEAGSSKEGIEVYKQEKPDVIFMDVNMPGIDGIDALDQLMEHDPDAFVIMLTSVSTRESVEKAILRGASQYIRKDTPKEEMIKILKDTFDPQEEPAES